MVDQLMADEGYMLMSSEEGHGRMFAYDEGGYKAITSSVVVGALADSDSLSIKAYLLSEFVDYFIGLNPELTNSLVENLFCAADMTCCARTYFNYIFTTRLECKSLVE